MPSAFLNVFKTETFLILSDYLFGVVQTMLDFFPHRHHNYNTKHGFNELNVKRNLSFAFNHFDSVNFSTCDIDFDNSLQGLGDEELLLLFTFDMVHNFLLFIDEINPFFFFRSHEVL